MALLYKYTKGKPNILCIVETKAADGARIDCNGISHTQVAPTIKQVQDTGAGDTFSGSLLFDFACMKIKQINDFSRLSYDDIKRFMENAAAVSALTVQGFGINHLYKNSSKLKTRRVV